MNASDFRRIALSLEGAEEGSHHGQADFRVGGRIFATLAAEKQGYGNLMLTPGQQAVFVEELPGVFRPVRGGWGRNGATLEWQGSAVEKPSRLGKVEDKRRLLQILMQELAEYTERPPT